MSSLCFLLLTFPVAQCQKSGNGRGILSVALAVLVTGMQICLVQEDNITECGRACVAHCTASNRTAFNRQIKSVFCMCKLVAYHLTSIKRMLIFIRSQL